MSVDFRCPGVDDDSINYANLNACAVLRVLGYDTHDLYGSALITEFRARLVRGINREQGLQVNARPHQEEGNHITFGMNAEQLRARLQRLLDYCVRHQAKGAVTIYWS